MNLEEMNTISKIFGFTEIFKKTINLFLYNSAFKIPTYSLEVQILKDIFFKYIWKLIKIQLVLDLD